MIIRLTPKLRRLMFSMVIISMCFIPFVDAVPLNDTGYYYTPCWDNGCWNANTGLPTCDLSFSPPKYDVNISYLVTSPTYSSPYSQYIDIENRYFGAYVCGGLSPPNYADCGSQRGFLNQSFIYDSCNRLNISFYMKVNSIYLSPHLAVRTAGDYEQAHSTTTSWEYYSFEVSYPISGADFVEFRNEWISPLQYAFPNYYVVMANYHVDDVYIHCEDPYSADNWIVNGDLNDEDETACPPPPPEPNPCDDLYIITDRGILVLLESSLQFVINLIQCWSPLWVFIFLASIGGILLMAFKNLARQ